MSDKQNIRRLAKRIGFLFLVILIYVMGTYIPLPAAQITSQYQAAMRETSLSVMGIMSGANFTHLSIFSIGLNPFMIGMLVMQLLSMIKILGFDALSVTQKQIVQQIIILLLSVIQATFFTFSMLSAHDVTQYVFIILILVAGSMLVTWLCFMNIKFGVGGTLPIIFVNILGGLIPTLTQVIKDFAGLPHSDWLTIILIIISLFCIFFWVAFSHAYYPIKSIDVSLPSYAKPVVIPLGLNMGAMMTYMIGMAILTIPTMLAPYFGPHSLLSNEYFIMALIFLIAFALFYFFTFMQFEPQEQARSLRDSNNYILGVRPGKPTQKYLRRLLWVIAFPGALLTASQLTLGLQGAKLLGNYSGLAIIPMNVVMVTMFSLGMKDQISTLLYPLRYQRLMKEG